MLPFLHNICVHLKARQGCFARAIEAVFALLDLLMLVCSDAARAPAHRLVPGDLSPPPVHLPQPVCLASRFEAVQAFVVCGLRRTVPQQGAPLKEVGPVCVPRVIQCFVLSVLSSGLDCNALKSTAIEMQKASAARGSQIV